MNAYIVETGKGIEPFGDLACDCLILNQPLSRLQIQALEQNSLDVVRVSSRSEISDPGKHLVVSDNVFFTPELIREFLRRVGAGESAIACALKNGLVTQRTGASVQDVLRGDGFTQYNLCYIPRNGHDNLSRVTVIDPDEFSIPIKMPYHMCGANEYQVPMTSKLIIQIDHWVNLWAANILSLLAEGARLKKKPWPVKLWLTAKAMSFNKWNILWHLNKVGRGCDVHPTAYVEGCTIGNNVTIGARAVVRASVIGDNVTIGNSVVVEESVVGTRSTILVGHVLYSLFYPGIFSVAEMVTASLLGRDTFLGSNSILTDFRLDGKNVMVIKDGKLKIIDSGHVFLGACVGHRARIGSGVIVAPGRAIPNNLQITAGRERVVWEDFGSYAEPVVGLIRK